MNTDDLISLLESKGLSPRKNSTGYVSRCPAHDDHNPSLSIGTGKDGQILLHCHTGCSCEQITGALDIKTSDLFADRPDSCALKQQPQIVTTYDYHDESGKLEFQVCRKQPKSFRQRRPDPNNPGEWIWNTQGVQRVLYRLPEIKPAIAQNKPIYVAEGEKDVETLKKAGFTATCNPGGAGKWRDEYSLTLAGGNIIIIADKDEPGRKHAQHVARNLQGKARSVRVIELPDTNGRAVKDAHDYFDAGGNPAELDQIAQDTPQWREVCKDANATILDQRAFRPDAKPPPLQPRFLLCGNAVCTPGNLTSICSQVKTGKSAVIGAMLAAPMVNADYKADLLGFESANPDGLAVVHFDTEQSPDDFWRGVDRAIRRAGRTQPPPWLRSYCLTGLPADKCYDLVFSGIKLAHEDFGGIHSVMIDGSGDLVRNVNDPEECNAFVAKLHGLAIEYSCPIICVLHFNPGSDKSRGHLGSQLERKAESNLRLDKEDEITVLWSSKQRRAAIPREYGPRFRWNDAAGMHVSVECQAEGRRTVKIQAAIPQRDDVFSGRPAMRWSELQEAIQTTLKLTERTAEKRINDWRNWGIIEKSVAGLWIPRG